LLLYKKNVNFIKIASEFTKLEVEFSLLSMTINTVRFRSLLGGFYSKNPDIYPNPNDRDLQGQ